MKSYLPTAALISLALIVAGCAPAPEQPEPAAEAPTQAEDVAAIKKLIDDYLAAANAGDVSAVAAFYTDDAIRMPPNAPAKIGKEAIQSDVQTQLDQFTIKLGLEVVEVEVAGDWAFGRGSHTITLTPKAGGEPTEDSGKWIEILKRQPDGAWKIYRLIWNSDQPLPGAGE